MFSSLNLILLGFFLAPFYFFPSGTPQLTDFVYALSLYPLFFNNQYLNSLINIWPRYLLFFVIWVLFVSLIMGINIGSISSIIFSIYYLYNFLISSNFILQISRNRKKSIPIIKNFLWAGNIIILISIIAQFSLYRNVGTFNNPNQLALYGLCSVAIIQLLNNYEIPRNRKDLFIFISSTFFVIISLSIGAIIGLPLFVVASISKRKPTFFSLFLSLLLFISPIFLLNLSSDLSTRLTTRSVRFQTKLERLFVYRGYDRITKFPSYLLFGASEGNYERFGTNIYSPTRSYELHSAPGTVLFCYGIIGFVLFSLSIHKIISPFNFQTILLLMPILIYSLTHNSLRFTPLWIVFAIIYLKKIEPQKNS